METIGILDACIWLAQVVPGGQSPPGGQQGPPPWTMWVWILIFVAAMYFLLLRPQQKQQKEHRRMISEVKSGDKIVTSGGIHGVIANVKDKTFVVRVADGVKIEVDKAAVTRVLEKSSDSGSESQSK
jgi:preprotein translocase subunit YajC